MYRVIGLKEYVEINLSNMSAADINEGVVDSLKSTWEELRKGYNFVIATGGSKPMFYSVPYFNENLICKGE